MESFFLWIHLLRDDPSRSVHWMKNWEALMVINDDNNNNISDLPSDRLSTLAFHCNGLMQMWTALNIIAGKTETESMR